MCRSKKKENNVEDDKEIKGETMSVTAFLSVSQFNGNMKKLEVFQDLCTLRMPAEKQDVTIDINICAV